MTNNVEWNFPQFDSGSILNAELLHQAGTVAFKLTVDVAGRLEHGELKFIRPRSYRWRAEAYCTALHITNCFLALCRVDGSEWIAEINAQTQDGREKQWALNHFIFFVPDFSCFEILCERWETSGFFSEIPRTK